VADVWDDIAEWADRGDRIALAIVVGTKRSAPRPVGSKMAINDRGEVSGGVSGGCVEGAVVEIAEHVIRDGVPQLVHFGIADSEAFEVGLPCGGEIDVWIEPYARSPFEGAARTGVRAAQVTVLEGEAAGRKVVITPDGTRVGSLGAPHADDDAVALADQLIWTETGARRGPLFIDVVGPRPRLMLVGAVDVAAALSTLAKATGWRSYVIDPRAKFATPERFPDAEEVVALWPAEAMQRLGGIDPATSIVALTHDPKLDDAALALALRSNAAFVGAMGSRKAQADRRARLLDVGLLCEEVDRLSAPVGLDLGATSPEETALSILAEVVAARHGHEGGRLSERTGRIHIAA
jgi:xanthine dehydrogenase accessory factor